LAVLFGIIEEKEMKMLKNKFVIPVLLLAIVASLGAAFFVYASDAPKDLAVNFLDIGQGSAILIQTPYGQNILIDGGDVDAQVIRQLPLFMPFYDRKIDLVILTHPHDDHVGGLVPVLKRYRVGNILYTGVTHSAPAYLEFLQAIKERNIPLTIITQPQTISLGDDLRLDILYPLTSFLQKEVPNLNNTSIVTLLTYKHKKFLFTGDAEKEVEETLAASPRPLGEGAGGEGGVDVMLAGHHGSDTSSMEDFLNAVKPRYAVVQVGVDNDFGHPSLRVLRRFDRMGILYFRNDLDGWVRAVSDGEQIVMSKEK
jgi:competence protein ComEC